MSLDIKKPVNSLEKINSKLGEIWISNEIQDNVLVFDTKKDKERFYIKNLLNQFDSVNNLEIHHNRDGSPYLNGKDSSFISISHSKDYCAIYFSEIQPVGIDIQLKNENIIRGKDYFINQNELEQFPNLTIDEASYIWCSKEAFYKRCYGKIEDLKEDVSIVEIKHSENLIVLIYQTVYYHLTFRFREGYYLVYTID